MAHFIFFILCERTLQFEVNEYNSCCSNRDPPVSYYGVVEFPFEVLHLRRGGSLAWSRFSGPRQVVGWHCVTEPDPRLTPIPNTVINLAIGIGLAQMNTKHSSITGLMILAHSSSFFLVFCRSTCRLRACEYTRCLRLTVFAHF